GFRIEGEHDERALPEDIAEGERAAMLIPELDLGCRLAGGNRVRAIRRVGRSRNRERQTECDKSEERQRAAGVGAGDRAAARGSTGEISGLETANPSPDQDRGGRLPRRRPAPPA